MTPMKIQPAVLTVITLLGCSLAGAAPPLGAPAPAPIHGASGPMPGKKAPPAPVKLVDINSASLQQLKTLPGIGDAEAKKIVAHRPYLTKTELVTKGVLPTGPFLSLKRQVVAMPPKKKSAAKAQP